QLDGRTPGRVEQDDVANDVLRLPRPETEAGDHAAGGVGRSQQAQAVAAGQHQGAVPNASGCGPDGDSGVEGGRVEDVPAQPGGGPCPECGRRLAVALPESLDALEGGTVIVTGGAQPRV